jgi:hypothetical protein
MTQLLLEHRISLTQLAREQKVNPATPWRWVRNGVRGIRLETFLCGGRRFTTREAFARWVAAMSGLPHDALSSANDKNVQAAKAQLAAAGI